MSVCFVDLLMVCYSANWFAGAVHMSQFVCLSRSHVMHR